MVALAPLFVARNLAPSALVVAAAAAPTKSGQCSGTSDDRDLEDHRMVWAALVVVAELEALAVEGGGVAADSAERSTDLDQQGAGTFDS